MKNLNRREFMGAAVAGMALQQTRALPRRPNVIFILADDMGYGDLSSYGRPDYKTPVLDSLADEGIRFLDNYTGAPVCTPTRVSFHTGRYPHRLPVGLQEPLGDANQELGIPAEHPTLASLLKANSYETSLVGKWHVGNAPQFLPTKKGFDEFFGIVSGGQTYFSHKNTAGVMDLFDGDKPAEVEGYLTDLFTERAIKVIQRRRTRPFFLSLMYNAPHWPWEGPNDRATAITNPRAAAANNGSVEIYGEMMKSMDSGIGRVLQALRDAKLEQNTLVIFTSDNGGERYSYNWPFAFQKTNLWEGGIRVPAIARWPGVIASRRTTDQAAITMDWTATILAATGTKASAAYPLDGADLTRVLTGERQTFERTIFWRNRIHDAARMGTWKYLKENNQEHLFDLVKDPGERFDLKEKEAATFRKIQAAYNDWNSKMLPRPPAPAGPARGAGTPA
jgi:arylsulfatase A-like enzyme